MGQRSADGSLFLSLLSSSNASFTQYDSRCGKGAESAARVNMLQQIVHRGKISPFSPEVVAGGERQQPAGEQPAAP
jgi:hypothetical protein